MTDVTTKRGKEMMIVLRCGMSGEERSLYGEEQGLTRKRFASGWSGDPMFVSGLRVSREMEMDEYHRSKRSVCGTQLSDGSN